MMNSALPGAQEQAGFGIAPQYDWQATAAERKEERQRQAAAEAAARRAAQEEAQRRAALQRAEQERLAAEARRVAEERRRIEEARQKAAEAEAARQRAAAEEAARRERERQRLEEARRAAEMEARRLAAEAEARRRAQAEAKARRIAAEKEAEARRLAAEAEARRIAAEAEARRIAEEKARQRAAKRRAAILTLYFKKWRRRLARAKEVRAAQKGCSVGIVRDFVSAVFPGILSWTAKFSEKKTMMMMGSAPAAANSGTATKMSKHLLIPSSFVQNPISAALIEEQQIAHKPQVPLPLPPGWQPAAEHHLMWKIVVLEHAGVSVRAKLVLRRILSAGGKLVQQGADHEVYTICSDDVSINLLLVFQRICAGMITNNEALGATGVMVLAPVAKSVDFPGVRASLVGPGREDEEAPQEQQNMPPVLLLETSGTGACQDGAVHCMPFRVTARTADEDVAQIVRQACRWLVGHMLDGAAQTTLISIPLCTLLSRTLGRLLKAAGVAPEAATVDVGLARHLVDQVLVNAAEIILDAASSPEARLQWPPRQLAEPGSKLDGWWAPQRQQTLLASLASIRPRQAALLRTGIIL